MLTFPGAAGRWPWKTVRRTGCQGPVLSLRRYISSCDSQGLAAGPSAVPCSGCGLVGEVTGCHARVWAQRLDIPHGCRSRCEHGCGEISWRKWGQVCPVKAAVCLHVSVPPRWHPSQLSQRPTPASARAVSGVHWSHVSYGVANQQDAGGHDGVWEDPCDTLKRAGHAGSCARNHVCTRLCTRACTRVLASESTPSVKLRSCLLAR